MLGLASSCWTAPALYFVYRVYITRCSRCQPTKQGQLQLYCVVPAEVRTISTSDNRSTVHTNCVVVLYTVYCSCPPAHLPTCSSSQLAHMSRFAIKIRCPHVTVHLVHKITMDIQYLSHQSYACYTCSLETWTSMDVRHPQRPCRITGTVHPLHPVAAK